MAEQLTDDQVYALIAQQSGQPPEGEQFQPLADIQAQMSGQAAPAPAAAPVPSAVVAAAPPVAEPAAVPVAEPAAPRQPQLTAYESAVERRRRFMLHAQQQVAGLPLPAAKQLLDEAERMAEYRYPVPKGVAQPVRDASGRVLPGMILIDGKLEKVDAAKPSELVTQIGKQALGYLGNVDPMLYQLKEAVTTLKDESVPMNERIATAKTLGKLINSLQVGSPDAVGAEEARSLLFELNENIFNPRGFFTSEQVMGTNLPQFVKKMEGLGKRVQGARNYQWNTLRSVDPEAAGMYGKTAPLGAPAASAAPANPSAPAAPSQPVQPAAPVRRRFDTSGRPLN